MVVLIYIHAQTAEKITVWIVKSSYRVEVVVSPFAVVARRYAWDAKIVSVNNKLVWMIVIVRECTVF